ncbi:MAG: tetratricopeptide repeat protein [Tunicatimonas sp.]
MANIGALRAQDAEKVALAQQYDDQGEVEKAKSLYDELVRKKDNIALVHTRYVRLLTNNGYLDDAGKYIKKTVRQFPDNIIYRLDAGIINLRRGEEKEAERYFSEVMEEAANDPYKTRTVASHLVRNDLIDRAIAVYQAGRAAGGDDGMYALELANVYQRTNERDNMIEAYLTYANEDLARMGYVKNVLQSALTEEGDLDSLSAMLLDKVQQSPDNPLYNELLIWVQLQQKNFYGAFMQARALDRRNRTEGDRVMEVAGIALENRDYKNALKMYDYVVDKYPRTRNYAVARRNKISAREQLVKNRFPVDRQEIAALIDDYQAFIDESQNTPRGLSITTLEAMRSQANLYAFYLDEKSEAIQILEQVATHPRATEDLKAQCKLDMGDIYLLLNEPWESTLLYAQVEKSNKEELVGYEAKLRNGKLSYYQGNFALAQGHLDVLKEATTREIANDAMNLSLLIQNNTAFDSAATAMKSYAEVELLLFQNRPQQALAMLDSMLLEYGQHTLADEILWLKAKVNMRSGNFEQSLSELNRILESYPRDILGDDALFMIGRIYEEQIMDEAEAMKVYTQFLKDYPGSIYVADVRKRFRKLRGDFNINN